MKKILALVLAAVMVLGMGMTGFAVTWGANAEFRATVSGNENEVTTAGTLTATIPLSALRETTTWPADVVGDEIVSFNTNRLLYDYSGGLNDNGSIAIGGVRDITSILQDSDVSLSVSSSSIRISVKLPANRFEVGDILDFSVTLSDSGTPVINYTHGATRIVGEGDIAAAGLVANFLAEVVSSTTTDDTTAPTVSSSPYVASSNTAGKLTINFSEVMNTTAGVGTITIANLNDSLWSWDWNSTGTAAVVTLTGMTAGTTYNAVLTGFEDLAGNVMTATGSVTQSFTSTSNVVGSKTSVGKASTFADNMSLAYGVVYGQTGRYLQYDLGDVHPADKEVVEIYLYSTMFNWNTEGAGNTLRDYYLTSQVIRNSKISARTQVAAGSKAIDSTVIKYDSNGYAYIKVKFVEEWVSVDELDFEFTTYLLTDGKRRDTDGEGVTFTGTLKNYVIYVYSNDDYVDTSLGEVAHAQDFVSSIEVDLGSGVSIFTKFFKDKKYYGTATRDADEAADVVFAKYPDVDNVVILKTVGLNSTGDIVKLDTDYSDYYVYDKDLNYLGQSNTRLPFSSRYYLANRKLDVDSDYEAEDPGEEPEWTDNAETGGDAGVSNANANPGTGR